MENVILIIALVAILGGASFYIWRARKKGQKCIGCPSGSCEECRGNCHEE